MGPDQIIRRDAVDTGRTYLCIDLKSFYASVECVDRGLDPFKDNLVVADPERSRTTICLAASPAIKALGVPSRCRVYEIPKNIQYTMAPPRMKRYMEVSAQIYGIYLRRISAQDIHVYSIDECFIDATPYLSLYRTDARSLAQQLMDDVREECGICATAGIGTNLFLAKVALDVTAKHVDDHIGYLDEREFRRKIWHHRPITDIWGIGPGIARRLLQYNVQDLAGITQVDERFLHKEFGVNAEYLIDHAWGYEPCTMADIHAYRPHGHSTSNGQVRPHRDGDGLCPRPRREAPGLRLGGALCGVLVGRRRRAVGGRGTQTRQAHELARGAHGPRARDIRRGLRPRPRSPQAEREPRRPH